MSICMDCRNYRCSWLQRHKPVDGWNAIRADLRIKTATENKFLESYDVKECPLFIPPKGYKGYKAKPPRPKMKLHNSSRCIPIVAYNPQTKERRRYDSMGEATKDGFTRKGISNCVNGKLHTHRGWYFEKA